MKGMLHLAEAPSRAGKTSDFTETYRRAFRWMLLARVAEEKIASLFRGGRITGGVFLGRGQEAISVATGIALREGDIFAPLIWTKQGVLRLEKASMISPSPIWARDRAPCGGAMETCTEGARGRGFFR